MYVNHSEILHFLNSFQEHPLNFRYAESLTYSLSPSQDSDQREGHWIL